MTHLGSAPASVLFETGHLSVVVGVVLDDGREVVVKVRPDARRVGACFAVQRHLHGAGFPCPEPIAGPAPLGPLVATAEAYVAPRGSPPTTAPAAAMAQLLARLVDLAPPAEHHAALHPAPPWVGWDHDRGTLWPVPDDLTVDLDAQPGPAWVDDAARRIRSRLEHARGAEVVGHADWEVHNLDWCDGLPVVVHDWDSVAIRTDAALAGAAAAAFPSGSGDAVAATVEQTHEFLEAYRARRTRWTSADEQTAWAAGAWLLAYNAKKESLGGGAGYLAHLEGEIDERLRLAGA